MAHSKSIILSTCIWCVSNPSEKLSCQSCTLNTELIDLPETLLKLESSQQENYEEVKFPGPGIVKHTSNFGNHIIASRRIEKGELIIEEKPLLVSPYGTSEMMPYCLSCYKDLSLSAKCYSCRWPVCDLKCQMSPQHLDNECDIFTKHAVRPKAGVSTDYFAVEVLRCLLLRNKNPTKWNRILQLEAHIEARKNVLAIKTRDFVLDFIFRKCHLKEEFSEEIVDRVLGVLSVNTFWGYKELQRYVSILFDKITLFNHDCDPNTTRSLVRHEDEVITEFDEVNNNIVPVDCKEDYYSNSGIRLRVVASRTIEPGDMITIQYVDCSMPVQERRQELKELFYFDCNCTKCLVELTTEVKIVAETTVFLN